MISVFTALRLQSYAAFAIFGKFALVSGALAKRAAGCCFWGALAGGVTMAGAFFGAGFVAFGAVVALFGVEVAVCVWENVMQALADVCVAEGN